MHSKTQVIVSSARNNTLKGIFDIYFKFFVKLLVKSLEKVYNISNEVMVWIK